MKVNDVNLVCVYYGRPQSVVCLKVASVFIRIGVLIPLCDACSRNNPSVSSQLHHLPITAELLTEYIMYEIMES